MMDDGCIYHPEHVCVSLSLSMGKRWMKMINRRGGSFGMKKNV